MEYWRFINWRGRTCGIPNRIFFPVCLLLAGVLLVLGVMADGGSGKPAKETLLPADARYVALNLPSQGTPVPLFPSVRHPRQLADCGWPKAGMPVVWIRHNHRYMLQPNGRIQCVRHPQELHVQLDLQKELAEGYRYVGFGPVRNGVDGSLGRTLWKNFNCRENIYRVGFFVFGVSSSGVPYSGQLFCTPPLLVGADYCFTGHDPRPTGQRRKTHRCAGLVSDAAGAAGAAELHTAAAVHLASVRVPRKDSVLGCDVSVKLRLLTLEGNPVKQAYTKLACPVAPRSFHGRVSMQQKKSGEWATIARGKVRRANPFPFHYYWLNRACTPGTFRAVFTAGGVNHSGMSLGDTDFYSKPRVIRNCTAGGQHPSARAAIPVILVHISPAIVADCSKPRLSYYKHWNHITGQWEKVAHMALECDGGVPRLLNWQFDTQQWHKGKNGAPGHWRYYKFNKQHHLVPPHSGGFHSDGQVTKCSPGTFRSAVQIWGTSSTGLVDPGEMFCTEPGFKIRSCAPKGPGRGKPRVNRVHPSVPGQKTVRCDPLPGPV